MRRADAGPRLGERLVFARRAFFLVPPLSPLPRAVPPSQKTAGRRRASCPKRVATCCFIGVPLSSNSFCSSSGSEHSLIKIDVGYQSKKNAVRVDSCFNCLRLQWNARTIARVVRITQTLKPTSHPSSQPASAKKPAKALPAAGGTSKSGNSKGKYRYMDDLDFVRPKTLAEIALEARIKAEVVVEEHPTRSQVGETSRAAPRAVSGVPPLRVGAPLAC